ncbi:hypothetical protein M0R19_06680 [Candidatus Pacearchaeota archaeon]|jgi:hypothetical protein|nr:hypothetical protein [Candidatus Pacearchaeota archaeon]
MLKDRIKEITKSFKEKKLSKKEIYELNKYINDRMMKSFKIYKIRNIQSEIDARDIYINY